MPLPPHAIPVLDHGFVRVLEVMGDDVGIVGAARVSFGNESKGEKADRGLIKYLLAHDHGTPFEMTAFKFHIRAPIFVARQWFRHRWSSFNEISGRYVSLEHRFFLPSTLRTPDMKNKQGSVEGGFSKEEEEGLLGEMDKSARAAYSTYESLLEAGVAREIARTVLPLSLYTEFYWKVNARSLMNFLRLRTEIHAQKEIRAYAVPLLRVFEEHLPWTASAFRELFLSSLDLDPEA
ncbi:FAD-dependent thymidylate synthase [bacterium]|nr:FAD-dependent thymidylate synthase [bacterium]